MPDPARVYRLLLKMYPARFREEYQAPMERQFRDDYRDAASASDRALLWAHAIWDLVTSAPAEIARELGRDLHYALRVYRKRSFSATLAVIALGLALGASTGIFSILNALLLRSLPFADPDRLIEVQGGPTGPRTGRAAFAEWRRHSPYLESAAAFSSSEMNLALEHEALRVKAAETSPNFFQLLGTSASIGRTFAADDPASVVVVSYTLWQQSFGGDRRALGARLRLNGTPLTIIGVAPPGFDYPGKTSVWLPTVFDIETVPKRGAFLIEVIGRLKPDVTMRQAREMEQGARLLGLRDQLSGSVRTAAWVLCGIVLFVLLAACGNVAQLLLSRTTERRQELALRAALGASRARLVQQLITEATLLTIAGAGLGLLVAHWAVRIAALVAPPQLATQDYTVFDWRVLGFAAALTLVSGVIFGVIPSWLVSRMQPQAYLVRTQSETADVTMKRIRAAILALQAGLTLTLVAGSMTLGRTFLKLLDSQLGFRPVNVLTLSVSLQGSKHRTGAAEWQYYNDVLDRLRAVPGIEAAGAASYLPLAGTAYMAGSLKLDSGQEVQGVVLNGATRGYFPAMGTKVLAGREFLASERGASEPPVVVNEAFAQQVGLGMSIVGRRLIAPWSKRPYQIVGVVDTIRLAGPAYAGGPQVFWPVQEEPPNMLTFVARVRGDAENYLASCRDAIRAVDREVAVFGVRTLEARVGEALARPRFYTTATLFFAALALLLAVIGIYGAASYSVAQRTHEMGVRMALGATPASVRGMVMRESLLPIGLGAAAGIVGALMAGQYLEHLIVRAEALEPATCSAAAVVLLAIAAFAAWVATARIVRIDPVEALRAV